MLNINTDINQSDAVHVSYFENHLAKKLPSFNLNTGHFYSKEFNRIRLFESEVKYSGWVFISLGHRIFHLKHKNPELLLEGSSKTKVCKYTFTAANFAPVTPEYIDYLLETAGSYTPPVTKKPEPVYEKPYFEEETKVVPLYEQRSPVFSSTESEEYQQHVENVLDRIRKTLITKGLEYHRNGNPYHNFDSTAQMNRQIPERALWGMVSKQITGCLDLIQDIEQGKLPSVGLIEEKCGDVRNYMILLEGVMKRTIAVQQGYSQVAA